MRGGPRARCARRRRHPGLRHRWGSARPGAGSEQRASAGDVAGVLHPGRVAGVQQQVGGGAQRLLGAAGDDDAARIGDQAAGRGQMGGDLLAQDMQALGRRIAGEFSGQGLQHARCAARPGFDREQVRRGQAAGEQQAQRGVTGRRGGGDLGQAGATGGQDGGGQGRGGGQCRDLVRQIGGDIGAAAGAAANVAFGGQAFISQHDGLAGNSKLLRQGTAGRQAPTRGQGAFQDAVAQMVEDGALAGLVWCEHGVVVTADWSNRHDLRPVHAASAIVHTYRAALGGFPKPRCPRIVSRRGLLEALALQPLALQLSGAAHGLRGFAGPTLGRLLVVPSQLHFAENPLPLHLLLERLERLINVVVTHENLHLAACSYPRAPPRSGAQIRPSPGIPARGLAL